ncbi:14375_t:CDS:1, partial [Racocetra fulgida]
MINLLAIIVTLVQTQQDLIDILNAGENININTNMNIAQAAQAAPNNNYIPKISIRIP